MGVRGGGEEEGWLTTLVRGGVADGTPIRSQCNLPEVNTDAHTHTHTHRCVLDGK